MHELDRNGVDWLLAPRKGQDDSLIIVAEWDDGAPRFDHRVLDVASVDRTTADDVAAALGDYPLLTHTPVEPERVTGHCAESPSTSPHELGPTDRLGVGSHRVAFGDIW